MGCGKSKPTVVSPEHSRPPTVRIGHETTPNTEKGRVQLSETLNDNIKSTKDLHNKLKEEQVEKNNLECQVRALPVKLDLHEDNAKQSPNHETKINAVAGLDEASLESERERKELENKIKIHEKRGEHNKGNAGVETEADKTSVDNNAILGSQEFEKSVKNENGEAAKEDTRNGTSKSSTWSKDGGNDHEKGNAGVVTETDDTKTTVDNDATVSSQELQKSVTNETGKDAEGDTESVTSKTSTCLKNVRTDHGKEDDEENKAETKTIVEQNKVERNDSAEINARRLDPRPPTLSKDDLIRDDCQFAEVDQHARNVPSELKTSLPDLVQYLCKTSNDPLFHVRAFFVWTTNNIKYDVAGYFGNSEKSPCDSRSVMETGLSVCEGYANVMQTMCKQADIEVKKIHGFAKGYSYSVKQQLTTRHQTNHAWNAVFIRGNWFLLDSTWGAGHLEISGEFHKNFDEFYFLTDPGEFVYSHFPYMNDDMEESQKWQLLTNPLSLERFNVLMKIEKYAFKIGVAPTSHPESVIKFEDELELSFKQNKGKNNDFLTTLYERKGNMRRQVKFSTYMYINDDDQLKIRVKPPETGEYQLEIFGRKITTNTTDSLSPLFDYVLHCEVPANKSNMRIYPYPEAYNQTLIDECHVLEPLGKQIPSNTEITMRFKSPHLKRMMIHQTMLKKDGDVFEGTFKTPDKNYLIKVYGSRSDSGSLDAQYQFCVG